MFPLLQKLISPATALGLGLSLALGFVTDVSAAETAEPSTSAAPAAPLRVLHIGNSFSMNATSYLPALAKAGGKPLEIFGATLGGCSFERHAKHLRQAKAGEKEGDVYTHNPSLGEAYKDKNRVSLPEALKAKPWNIVTIQQVSRQSFKPETFEPYASELISEIKSAAPTATIWIHQTWAYRPDHILLKKEQITPEKMQALANSAYEKLAREHGITHFLPSGLAVQFANRSDDWRYRPDPDFDYSAPLHRKLPVEQSIYAGPSWARKSKADAEGKRKVTLDASHLNDAGKYLTACVWYEMLFNDSVLNVDFTPKSLTSEQTASLRKIAHEAVAAYRQYGLSGLPPAEKAE